MDNNPGTTPLDKVFFAASKLRIAATRVFAGLLIVLVLVTNSSWPQHSVMDTLFETFGLILVTIGAFGRLWASLYISGYKVKKLVTEGPYSIVRNPLYLFSLLGAVGIGFAAESFLITVLVVIAFILYYPMVVAREEKKLADLHGEEYAQYASQTPRFIPRLASYHQPERYSVSVRKHQQAFLDATFFIWIYGALQLVETLHDSGLLPVLFKIS